MASDYTFEVTIEGQQRIQRLSLKDNAATLRIQVAGHSRPVLEVALMRGFNGITTIMITDPCDVQTGKKATVTRLIKTEDRYGKGKEKSGKTSERAAAGAEVLPAVRQDPGRAVDRGDGHAHPLPPSQDGGAQPGDVPVWLREDLLGD